MIHKKRNRYQFGGVAKGFAQLGELGYKGFHGAADEYGVYKSDIGPAIGTTVFKPHLGTALSLQHFAEAKTPEEKFSAIGSTAIPGISAYQENVKRRQDRDKYISQLQDIESQKRYESDLTGNIYSTGENPELPEYLKTNRATISGGIGAIGDIFRGHYGGEVPVNIERNELEVRNGRIIRDFKAKPLHPKDENLIDLDGNIMAVSGNIIIPANKRKSYMEGDRITKNTIEAQIKKDQLIRDREELKGYRAGKGRWLKAQKGIDVPEEYKTPYDAAAYAYDVDSAAYAVNKKDKEPFDFGQAGLDFSEYAPALYNVGMGLFGGKSIPDVPPIYNPRRERVAELMRKRQVDLDPILRDIELGEATGERALRESSAGTPGLYVAGRTALSNASQRAKAKARMQADLVNQGYRADEAQILSNLGAEEARAEETSRAMKIAFQANLAKYLPTGLGQISGIAQSRNRDRILKEELARRKAAAEAAAAEESIEGIGK